MVAIDLGHYTLCAAYLVYTFLRAGRFGQVTLFHFTSMAYTLSVLLFFPFARSFFYTFDDQTVAFRGLLLAVIFIGGCVAADRFFYGQPRDSSAVELRPTPLLTAGLWFFMLFGLLGFYRFFFIGGAIDHIGEVLGTVLEGGDYRAAREAVGSWMLRQPGLGVSHATGAVYTVFPVISAVSVLMWRKYGRPSYILFALVAILASISISSIFMERAPILFTVLTPLVVFFVLRPHGETEELLLSWRVWKYALPLFGVLVAGGMVVYSYTDADDNPLVAVLQRVFVVPSVCHNIYLGVFPDQFQFRGWAGMLNMVADTTGTDVTTRDIARYLSGGVYSYNPNAGILATAYSGAGMAGVMIITVLYLLIVVLIDKAFARLTGELRVLNILVSLYSWPTLTNAPILVAIIQGGFGVPSLLLLALFRAGSKVRSQPSSEAPLPDAGTLDLAQEAPE